MTDPDEYPWAVIRRALEESGVTGDLDGAADLTYRMLLAGAMLQSAYWPRDYMKDLMEQAKRTDRRGSP